MASLNQSSLQSTRTRPTEAGGLPWKYHGRRKGGVSCNHWGPGCCGAAVCLVRPHRADLPETCQLKGTSLTVKFPERQRLENKRPWGRSSGEEICQHRARKGRSVANLLHEEAHANRFAAHIFFGWRFKGVKHRNCAGHLRAPVSIPASNGLAGMCANLLGWFQGFEIGWAGDTGHNDSMNDM
jgi:hypothetical protein